MTGLNFTARPYGIVYQIRHKTTGKSYVGQTVGTISERWRRHVKTDCCRLLHRAIKKHGEDSFEIFQIDTAFSKEELDQLEDHHIRRLNTLSRSHGYNLREGGSWGKHSEESRAIMSEKVQKALLRPEYRQALSRGQKGRPHSPEHNAKVAASLTGKKLSEPRKKKMSEITKSRWEDPAERAKMRLSSIEARSSQSFVERVAATTKDQWNDPEKRAHLLAAQAAGKAAFWADPEKRAARIAKRAATIASKRAA